MDAYYNPARYNRTQRQQAAAAKAQRRAYAKRCSTEVWQRYGEADWECEMQKLGLNPREINAMRAKLRKQECDA